MDNHHDLIVDCKVTQEVGIGVDQNYDTRGFLAEIRRIGVTPHVIAYNLMRLDNLL
jgi:hypothetical protein